MKIENLNPSTVDIGKGRFYLDADVTGVRSRYVTGGRRALDTACAELVSFGEGQIGIYRSQHGDGFAGYVIKYRGEVPYFEKVTE